MTLRDVYSAKFSVLADGAPDSYGDAVDKRFCNDVMLSMAANNVRCVYTNSRRQNVGTVIRSKLILEVATSSLTCDDVQLHIKINFSDPANKFGPVGVLRITFILR